MTRLLEQLDQAFRQRYPQAIRNFETTIQASSHLLEQTQRASETMTAGWTEIEGVLKRFESVNAELGRLVERVGAMPPAGQSHDLRVLVNAVEEVNHTAGSLEGLVQAIRTELRRKRRFWDVSLS